MKSKMKSLLLKDSSQGLTIYRGFDRILPSIGIREGLYYFLYRRCNYSSFQYNLDILFHIWDKSDYLDNQRKFLDNYLSNYFHSRKYWQYKRYKKKRYIGHTRIGYKSNTHFNSNNQSILKGNQVSIEMSKV
jgi:hypothetical protein